MGVCDYCLRRDVALEEVARGSEGDGAAAVHHAVVHDCLRVRADGRGCIRGCDNTKRAHLFCWTK